MRKSVILSVLILSVASTSAMALSMSDTQSFEFTLSPNSQTLHFDQFYVEGYQLTSVTLELLATEQANVSCENDDTITAYVSVSLTGFVTGEGAGGLSTSTMMSESSEQVELAPSEDPVGGGADYHDFGLLYDTDTDTDTIFSNLSAYIGQGTVDIVISGQGGHAVLGTSDYTLMVDNFKALGDAKITYEYEQIPAPEPSTMVLLGSSLAGVAFIARRKLRK